MDQKAFKDELNQRRLKLAALMEQRSDLDHQIARLRLDIRSLVQLSGEPSVTEDEFAHMFPLKGLSEACREVLTAFTEPLTVSEIIDNLKLLDYNLSDYANAAASVQTTVKRMTEGDHPDVIETYKDGKKAFQLKAHSTKRLMRSIAKAMKQKSRE